MPLTYFQFSLLLLVQQAQRNTLTIFYSLPINTLLFGYTFSKDLLTLFESLFQNSLSGEKKYITTTGCLSHCKVKLRLSSPVASEAGIPYLGGVPQFSEPQQGNYPPASFTNNIYMFKDIQRTDAATFRSAKQCVLLLQLLYKSVLIETQFIFYYKRKNSLFLKLVMSESTFNLLPGCLIIIIFN